MLLLHRRNKFLFVCTVLLILILILTSAAVFGVI